MRARNPMRKLSLICACRRCRPRHRPPFVCGGATDCSQCRCENELSSNVRLVAAGQRGGRPPADRLKSGHDPKRRVSSGERCRIWLSRRQQPDDLEPLLGSVRGPHWWNVMSHDREEFNTFYSAPSPFTVAAQTRVRQLRIRRNAYFYIPDELSITVGWATNVRNVVVEAKLYRGRRQVGRVRDTTETLLSLSGDSSTLTWKRPPLVKAGTRLRVVVSVRGGGAVASLQRFVQAP